MDQLDLDLLFVLYKNTVDYSCHNLYHCHFDFLAYRELHLVPVRMHSLVVVLPGYHLGTFVEHCLFQYRERGSVRIGWKHN